MRSAMRPIAERLQVEASFNPRLFGRKIETPKHHRDRVLRLEWLCAGVEVAKFFIEGFAIDAERLGRAVFGAFVSLERETNVRHREFFELQ